jgi:hypothetical protein
MKGEEVEAWLLGLKKYFQVHNYSKNTKVRIDIFILNGGVSIWWEDLKELKGLKEIKLIWKYFDKYFKKACMLEKYCYNPNLHQICLPGIRPSQIPSFPKHY